MTYQELLEALMKLSPTERQQTVTVGPDVFIGDKFYEFFAISKLITVEGSDLVDDGQIVLT